MIYQIQQFIIVSKCVEKLVIKLWRKFYVKKLISKCILMVNYLIFIKKNEKIIIFNNFIEYYNGYNKFST